MASAIPAILASILGQTAAGLPKGLHEADVLTEQAAARAGQDATRAQQQSQFDTQQARMDSQFREQQERLTRAETTDLAPFYDQLGLPRPANTRVPTNVAGPILTAQETRRKEAAEQADRTAQSDFIAKSKGAPGQLMQTLGMGEDPEAAALLPRTNATPRMDDRDLAAGLASFRHVDPNLYKLLAPKEPTASQETRVINGRQMRITYDSSGSVVGQVDIGPASDIDERKLELQGRTEERRGRMDDMTTGLIERAMGGDRTLSGAPGAPGAAAGGGQWDPSLSFGPGGAKISLTPRRIGEEDKKALRAYDGILASLNELEGFSDEEVGRYAGFLSRTGRDVKQFAGSIPGLEGLADPRYAKFRALTGRLAGTAFAEGGKQLTPFEAAVVFSYTPTGKEAGGPVEFRAKRDQLKLYTTIRRQLTAHYAERGIDPTTIPDEIWDQQVKQGLGLSASGLTPPEGGAPGATPAGNDPLGIRR